MWAATAECDSDGLVDILLTNERLFNFSTTTRRTIVAGLELYRAEGEAARLTVHCQRGLNALPCEDVSQA